MVKNEQDVIEPFLRHNASLLDALVLLDNASHDNTRDIALACARELGNVVVGDSAEFSYLQSERMTSMLACCQEAFRADYILFLDADEFLSVSDRRALEIALSPIPRGGVGLVPWRTFVIRPGQEDAVAADPPHGFTHRRRAELPQFQKAVLRLDGRPASGLVVEQGNHNVLVNGQALASSQLEGLHLMHMPVRSGRQLAAKGVVGWTAYMARNPRARKENYGFQWREAFDRVVAQGYAALSDDIAAISFGYAQTRPPADWNTDTVAETLPFAYARQYSDGVFADPLSLVARAWERFLAEAPPRGADELAPLRFIIEKHQVRRILQISCGLESLSAMPEVEITSLDTPERQGGEMFDLIVCANAEGQARVLDGIDRWAVKRIAFAGTGPRPLSHLLREWATRGWMADSVDSLGMRALAALSCSRCEWVVLRRGSGMEAMETLPAIQTMLSPCAA